MRISCGMPLADDPRRGEHAAARLIQKEVTMFRGVARSALSTLKHFSEPVVASLSLALCLVSARCSVDSGSSDEQADMAISKDENFFPREDRPPRHLPPPPPPPPTLSAILSQFNNYDMNGDGRAEINSLKPAFANPEAYTPQPNGLVIVFVDPRLVSDDPNNGISAFEMKLWLNFYGTDMFDEGYFPYFVEADVYNGTEHQDGRTLLAMRRFLQRVKKYYPLSGTLLFGSFPEAGIVRSV